MPLLALGLLTLTACGGKSATDDTGTNQTTDAAAPTWSADVAPIFAQSCMGCHVDGGIGPFDLTTYDGAVAWAAPAAAAVAARIMPPFLVTGDGSCGDWADNEWLADADIQTIQAWADAGAPQGDPSVSITPPQPRVLPDGASSFSTPAGFVPEIAGGDFAEFDEYRCFDVGTIDQDSYLTGYDVSPGNDAIVHHVITYIVDPDQVISDGRTGAQVMADLDAEDSRDGWPCFGAAGSKVPVYSVPVVWAPGQGAVLYPDGTGVEVSAGQHLITQVHYNLVDPQVLGQSDQTTVSLLFDDTVQREGFFALPDGLLATMGSFNEADIPAGEAAWTYSWDMQTLDLLGSYGGSYDGITSAELWGVLPHMHNYGTAMSIELDGSCAAQVNQWNFAWQRIYFYQEGVPLTGDETLSVSCTYNTEGLTEDVSPGWGSYNEMCLAGVYVVLNRD